jgi:flavin reductase (DIM6/NTAB) family NADH-FMN oxidoreductase RutF
MKMKGQAFFLLSQLLLLSKFVVEGLRATSTPPLVDVPTYSLATVDESGKTGMNIVTYATPISIRPDRIWTLGLFKGTVAHENFSKSGKGVLQLLSPDHAKVVKLLGGSSGKDVDKKSECETLGMPWISIPEDDGELPDLLPNCTHYMKLTRVGDLIDCGTHDLAICEIESMFTAETNDSQEHLKTATLRELGIITEQGRVAED